MCLIALLWSGQVSNTWVVHFNRITQEFLCKCTFQTLLHPGIVTDLEVKLHLHWKETNLTDDPLVSNFTMRIHYIQGENGLTVMIQK